MAGEKFVLHLDTKAAKAAMDKARSQLTKEQFIDMLRKLMPRIGTEMKTVIAREVRKDYNVKYGDVLNALQGPYSAGGGGGFTVRLPISRPRFQISKTANTTTRKWGKMKRKRGLRPAEGVKAGFVKGGEENLPTSGRRAHYFDHKGRLVVHKLGDSTVVFKPFSKDAHNPTTKKYASTKMNVSPAVGIGIPQMPMTRSADRVQREMDSRLEERTVQYTKKVLDKAFG